MPAGVSGFERQGVDPVEGTGAPNAFMDTAVPSGAEPRPQQYFCLPSRATIAFSDLRFGARPPPGLLGPEPGRGSGPAQGRGTGSGSAAAAGSAAGGTRGGAGSPQTVLAPAPAPDQAAHAPGSSPAAAAAVPDQAALAPALPSSAHTPASAPDHGDAQPAAAIGTFDARAAAASGGAGGAAAAGPSSAACKAPSFAAAAAPTGGMRGREAGAAVDAPADAPGSGGAARPGQGGREGDPGAQERWRFSLRGLFDAMGVDLFMQAVGSNVDPATVDRVISSAAGEGGCQSKQLLGKLPVEVQTQLLDATAPGRLVRMLQTLEAMGLITAEARGRDARASVPPATALTYVASAQIKLEEPEDLADPTLLGEPLGLLASAPTGDRAPVPPGAPEAQPPEALITGGFRRRSRVYDLREAMALERYWARLEIVCTLWCACRHWLARELGFCVRLLVHEQGCKLNQLHGC